MSFIVFCVRWKIDFSSGEKPYYEEREASDQQDIDLHAKENLFGESADLPATSAGDGSQVRTFHKSFVD